MVDNLSSEDGRDDLRRPESAGVPRAESLADREVSLGGDSHPALAVHQWLDGEAAEGVARRANTRDVELWNRINEEAARRGRMQTPAPVMDRIMAAIPEARPIAPSPWWKRPAPLSTSAALAAAAGLLALGAVLGTLVR